MKKLIAALMMLGIIGIALNTIFGWQTFTYLTVYRTDTGIYLYKMNMWGYVDNLKNSFATINRLTVETPTREWNNDLLNNLALMLDWVLFGWNLILYPFRIGGYVILQTLAIIGINTVQQDAAGGLNWLVISTKFLRDLTIPYV